MGRNVLGAKRPEAKWRRGKTSSYPQPTPLPMGWRRCGRCGVS